MGLETLAIAALATTAVASTVSAIGSIQSGNAAQAIGESNAALDEQDSQNALQTAETEANAIRERNRRVAASQRTSFLKSGITLDGMASDVMYDSAIQGELEALASIHRGKIAATASSRQAKISRLEGSSRKSASRYQAAGTILSGAGDALSIVSNPSFKKGSNA